MRRRGVMLPPSQFEAAFWSTAHRESEVATVIEAARHAFRRVREATHG